MNSRRDDIQENNADPCVREDVGRCDDGERCKAGNQRAGYCDGSRVVSWDMLWTVTPLDDPTLRMSLPSSASSRSMMSSGRAVGGSAGSASGLSPSSTGAKLGFRKAARNASAITAASAPENSAPSLPCDSVDAPSPSIDRARPIGAGPPEKLQPPVTGDCGSCAFRIMGVDEPIDPRCDSWLWRFRRSRRMMTNARITPASSARKPRTTMTAMAQCGNDEPPPDCTLPAVGDDVAPLPLAWADAEEAAASADDSDASDADAADAADAAETDATDADDAAAAAVIDAATASAKVVSIGDGES